MLGGRSSLWPFLALAVAVGIAALLVPRTPQPLSYHQFADRRSWLGIPNFGDVVSSMPASDGRTFSGLVLTAGGSAYYHLAPNNARLVWDRLPMTFVFMPLVAAILAERVNVKLGLGLLPLLVAVGMGSVIEWHWSEQQGAGDLRFYAAVQLYALLALLVALLLPPRYTRGRDLLVVAGLYVLAKICEAADGQIFSLGRFLSGHTLKHLAAGAAGLWMLEKRQPVLYRGMHRAAAR